MYLDTVDIFSKTIADIQYTKQIKLCIMILINDGYHDQLTYSSHSAIGKRVGL